MPKCEVIADLVRREVCKTLHNGLCYSVQIDGSMDRQQQDSKFVTARHVQENDVSVQTVFVVLLLMFASLSDRLRISRILNLVIKVQF